MPVLKAMCLLVITMIAAGLYALPGIEVYVMHPDSFEKEILRALENTIETAGDYTLAHSYRDAEFDTAAYNGITFATVDDTSEMGYLVFLKAMKLQGTDAPQVAVSLHHTIQGMPFYTELLQLPLGTPQSIAEAVYQGRLMFFHPLMAANERSQYATYKMMLTQDMQQYAAQIIQYWKTPISQGGAGRDPRHFTIEALNNWLNFPRTGVLALETGTLEITSISGAIVKLLGIPARTGSDVPDTFIIMTVDCDKGDITSHEE